MYLLLSYAIDSRRIQSTIQFGVNDSTVVLHYSFDANGRAGTSSKPSRNLSVARASCQDLEVRPCHTRQCELSRPEMEERREGKKEKV